MFQHPARRAASLWLGLALIASLSCSPPPFPPPPQVVMPSGPEPSSDPDSDNGGELLLRMSDPGADSRILADVLPEISAGEWRFTGVHPRFRFQLHTAAKLNFYLRFFLHEESLRSRGPVSFNIALNGNRFRTYRFTQPGDMEYRKPIPAGWIPPSGTVVIALDVDPPWRLPDGATLGVLLHSVGFETSEN